MENQEFTPVEEVNENLIAIVSEENFALIFNGKVDARIAEVEKELKSILRKEVSDKKAYQDLKDLKNKVIVKMRTATVAKSKEMTEGYKKNIAKIKEVENSIIERVTKKLESKADERIEAYEKLIREEQERSEREAKEKLDIRVSELIANGIVFNGTWYAIGQIQVGIQMIQEMDDTAYADLLSKVTAQNQANIAEQKRKDEEAEKERQAQEDLRLANEAKQKALQEQEDALNAKLKAIADAEAELERKAQAQKYLEEKQEQERKEEARKQQEREQEILIGQRMSRYEDLGMKYSYVKKELEWSNSIGQVMIQKDVFIDEPNNLYEDTINAINKYTEEEKEQIEKAEAERQVKIMADELKAEQQRIALQNDTEKFVEYLFALQNVPKPIITDTTLVGKLNAIINLINQ